jgi:hypothetical protein
MEVSIVNRIKSNSKIAYALILSLVVFFSSVERVFATPPSTPTTFSGFVDLVLNLIGIIIPAFFALVFVVIVWKIIDAWVVHGGEVEKRQEGRQLVLIGVVVFVLMMVTWGIVALLRNTFFG